jgi:hypothetical protein
MSYWEPSYGYYMNDPVPNACASPSQSLLKYGMMRHEYIDIPVNFINIHVYVYCTGLPFSPRLP